MSTQYYTNGSLRLFKCRGELVSMEESRFRKRRITIIIISFFLMLALIFIVNQIAGNNNSNTYILPEYTKNMVLNGIEIESIIENNPLHIAVHYPKVESQQINEIVYNMIETKLNDFKEQASEYINNEDKSELYISFEAYKYNPNLLSFKFKIYKYFSKNAHGAETIETMVFDLENNKLIILDDLFISSNYLEILSNMAYKHFSNLNEYNLDMLEEGLKPEENNFSNFILRDASLELIFEQYQIAEGVKGNISFKIPIDDLKEYINESIFEEEQLDSHNEIINSDTIEIPTDDIEELKDKKLIAITFDDGPHEEYTNELLDILKSENVKATFFVLGSRAEYYPETIRRIVTEGHQIGNHSYSHSQLTKLNENDLSYEINGTNEIIENITGIKSNAVRPPYGSFDDKVKSVCNSPIILWSVDPEDWKYQDPEKIYNSIISNVEEGDIILMHDVYSTSVEAAKRVIQNLKEEGYTFVTAETLIKVKQENVINNQAYYYVK